MKIMINENNKHSWCVNALHSMSAANDGHTKVCCMVKKSYNDVIGSSKDYFIGSKSIVENFDNIHSQKIRENLENGVRDAACTLCWQEEDGGRTSKRQRDNEKYIRFIEYGGKPFEGLAKFELNMGNTCNIKCRTCQAAISSSWMKEDYDLNHSNVITFKEYNNNMKKYHHAYDDESPFWDDLISNLHTIRQFDFYGGEPFLSKKMWEVLRICVEKDYAKDIELHYNTNGTLWPESIELWRNFKSVNLSFSIDGTDQQFEYMRHLAKWDEVSANMAKAVEFKKTYSKLDICWCVTLSTLNIYYLPEILDVYYKNFKDFGLYLNLVHGPQHYNISIMPEEVKNIVISRLENIDKSYQSAWSYLPGIIGFMKNGTPNRHQWKILINTIKKHDTYRDEDFYSTFKEFGEIVNASVLE